MKKRANQRKSGIRRLQNNNRNSNGKRSVYISFSEIEDNPRAIHLIRNLVAHAGKNAATEAKAAGLSRVYVRNNKELVKISASGDVIRITPRLTRSSFYVKYKPSTILHAVKK